MCSPGRKPKLWVFAGPWYAGFGPLTPTSRQKVPEIASKGFVWAVSHGLIIMGMINSGFVYELECDFRTRRVESVKLRTYFHHFYVVFANSMCFHMSNRALEHILSIVHEFAVD